MSFVVNRQIRKFVNPLISIFIDISFLPVINCLSRWIVGHLLFSSSFIRLMAILVVITTFSVSSIVQFSVRRSCSVRYQSINRGRGW